LRTGRGDLVASPELLQQALDKLVDNAVSFTTNAVVTLHVKSYRQSDAERVSLVVSNAGHVPPECDQAHVFDPMFSHRAQDDGNLHLGLGLYIVKMVAEAHRGEAAMSSSKGFVNVGMDLPRNMHAA